MYSIISSTFSYFFLSKQRKNPAYINPLWKKMCQDLHDECEGINVACDFNPVKDNRNASGISNSDKLKMDAGSKKRTIDMLL
jgi:hypothetical protein